MLTSVPELNQAREAEALTIEFERNRLKKLGIDKLPKWKSLDDSFAGYDVLSYDPGEFAPVNRMIQVKVTKVSPLRFILTREEWEHAQRFGAACLFHVWNMRKTPPLLYVYTADQIAPHVPSDSGNGRWKTVEVSL
jgi:hypothetical protein